MAFSRILEEPVVLIKRPPETIASSGARNMNAEPRVLPLGGQTQEFSFHSVDLGDICCDVVITAALPGRQVEAAARECRRWTGAAQMNYRSQLLPLLTADFRLSAVAENRCDVAVQEHRSELGGVTWHDPRMEQGRGTAGLNHGMVENLSLIHI